MLPRLVRLKKKQKNLAFKYLQCATRKMSKVISSEKVRKGKDKRRLVKPPKHTTYIATKTGKPLSDSDQDVDSNTALIAGVNKARRKLHHLLKDEISDQNQERLETLFHHLRHALRGDTMLLKKHVLEYATYLISTNNNLGKEAFDLWHQRLKHGVNVSKYDDKLRRPCNGDVIIDIFCDLLVTINTDKHKTSTRLTRKLSELLEITVQLTSLKNGLTTLLTTYASINTTSMNISLLFSNFWIQYD